MNYNGYHKIKLSFIGLIPLLLYENKKGIRLSQWLLHYYLNYIFYELKHTFIYNIKMCIRNTLHYTVNILMLKIKGGK